MGLKRIFLASIILISIVGLVSSVANTNINGIIGLNLGADKIGDTVFNGGWQNGGASILGGDGYFQTLYVYNLTSLNVTQQDLWLNNSARIDGTLSINKEPVGRDLEIKQRNAGSNGGIRLYDNDDDNNWFQTYIQGNGLTRLTSSGGSIFTDQTLSTTLTGWRLLQENPSNTNPVIIPRSSDLTTGIGSGSDGELNLISGSSNKVKIDSSGIGFGDDLFVNGNKLYLDADDDSYIYSRADDEVNTATGGADRTVLTNTYFRGDSATLGTGTFAVNLGVGSVGSPTYSFTGDADTGMYLNGANEIGFSTGNFNVMRLLTSAITINSADLNLDGGELLMNNNKDIRFKSSSGTPIDSIKLTGVNRYIFGSSNAAITGGTEIRTGGVSNAIYIQPTTGFVGVGHELPTQKVDIHGGLNQTSGNATINMIYGELYGMDIGEVAIASAGVYYNVTNTTEGLNNGVSFNTTGQGGLTIQSAGIYKVDSQWSFSDGATNEYHLSLGINGVQQDKCHAERVMGTGGDVGSASFTCLLSLSTGDVLTTMIENSGATNDPSIHNLQLNILRIGN